LARDRVLSLLRQAYVEKWLDPNEADFSYKWWLKAKLVTDWLEKKNQNTVWLMQHDLNCALLDYFTGDKALDLHWDQALTLQHSVKQSLLPWLSDAEQELSKRRAKDLTDMWKAIYGDPNSPETKELINKTVEALERQMVEGG
jgi:hypothetical protein